MLAARKFLSLKYKKIFRLFCFYFLILESFFLKYKKCFYGVPFMEIWEISFWKNVRNFFNLIAEKFHSQKYKKIFQSNVGVIKYKKLFNLRTRKFHFPKFKKIVFEKIWEIFLFFDLGLKSTLGSPTYYHWNIYQ